MTLALVSAPLTKVALASLEADFGWEVLASPGPSLLAGNGFDPAAVGVLVVEAERVDREVLERFQALSLVGCVRGEPANVDLDEATRRGVVVVRSPGRNAESVADLVLGLMLSVVRHIAEAHHLVVARQLTEDRVGPRQARDVIWRPSDPAAPVPYIVYKGPELATLVLGLLGFGATGRRVAVKAVALGMHVLSHDPFVATGEIEAAGAEAVSADELFERCDILSLHVPPQKGGPLVGERELGLMKPGSYLINTARASVLDYNALVRALRGGKLAGAGLDVFPDEPLSPSDPLLELANVTLTPHIGGASVNVVEHHSEILLAGLRALAAGRIEAANIRNPDALAHWPLGLLPAFSRTQLRAEEAGIGAFRGQGH
jgi:D-3-phosphoglycerate dehydrogenase